MMSDSVQEKYSSVWSIMGVFDQQPDHITFDKIVKGELSEEDDYVESKDRFRVGGLLGEIKLSVSFSKERFKNESHGNVFTSQWALLGGGDGDKIGCLIKNNKQVRDSGDIKIQPKTVKIRKKLKIGKRGISVQGHGIYMEADNQNRPLLVVTKCAGLAGNGVKDSDISDISKGGNNSSTFSTEVVDGNSIGDKHMGETYSQPYSGSSGFSSYH